MVATKPLSEVAPPPPARRRGGPALSARAQALLTVAIVVIVAAPGWATTGYLLDDAAISRAHLTGGFWGPTQGLYDTFGWYRPLATLLWSFVYVVPDALWVPRLAGVILHAVSCVSILGLWRRAGGTGPGAAALLIVFGLAPYSLEAIAWPATLPSYALPIAMALAGSFVAASARSSRGTAAGAALACTALLAQEQVLPLLVLLLGAVAVARHRGGSVLLGAALPAGVLWPATLLASVDSNSRFSGPDGASLENLRANLPLAPDYLRPTPLGDLWWSGQGVGPGVLLIGALVAVAVLLVSGATPLVRVGPAGEQSRALGRGHLLLVLLGGAALCAGAIAPYLLSGAPYLSARFAYLPVLGLAAMLAAVVEVLSGARRSWAGTSTALVLLAPLAVWSPAALLAEGRAYRQQFAADRAQLEGLDRAVPLGQLVADGTPLVVAGFPGYSLDRPGFGEHIIGLGKDGVRLLALQGSGVDLPPSQLDFRSGLDGLCLSRQGGFGLVPEWVAGRPEVWGPSGENTDRALFAIYRDGAWAVSAAGAAAPAAVRLNAVGQLVACSGGPS